MPEPLVEYARKRDFRKTPEPGPVRRKTRAQRRIFVVQEHHASQLHYDFRLEIAGVLKSWAVPKGPSLDPSVKRLAVEVEDHPLAYARFAGAIPEHQYGAGEVFIWDKGFWRPHGDPEAGLRAGRLEFTLSGGTLKGDWVLIRMRSPGRFKKSPKPQWLLVKRHDRFARIEPETQPEVPAADASTFKLTNPERVIYVEEGLTKADIANYYRKVAPRILPHLANRPLSFVRCPEGHETDCFVQKHFREELPGVGTVRIREKGGTRDHHFVDSLTGLLSLVQRGILEFHAWNCKAGSVTVPDRIVLDLDPGPGVDWHEIVAAATELRDLLAHEKFRVFVLATGGKGVHLHVPGLRGYTWEGAKNLAERYARALAARSPRNYIAESAKHKRRGKIFIDYLRNAASATAIVPYSLRARERSAVAMPVAWNELTALDGAAAFSLKRALAHIAKRRRDPWEGY